MAKLKLANKKGFSLVELILAVALFSLFATALVGLLWASYGSEVQAAQKDKATIYAQQGLEAVRSIRRQGWNLLTNGDYGLTNTNGYWEFFGSSDALADGFYTRVITIADACRDGSGNLVDCTSPGAIVDLYTKKIIATVSYTAITGISSEASATTYLTTWQSRDWVQTDWSGGSGQSIWLDITKYDSDNGNINPTTGGQISLIALGGGGCGVKVWPFAIAGNYTYDVNKIEVSSGLAQLKDQASSDSGITTNPNFNTDTTGWSYADWDQGGGEVNVTGNHQVSGGNPTGWVDIGIPAGKSDKVGGYWYQAFTTTVASPTVNVNIDWQVAQYNPTPSSFQVLVFVDSTAGAPILGQQVWSSGEITATQSWTTQASIDASSAVTTAGTYYLKIAVWVETPGGSSNTGPFRVGFDNVLLNWSGSSGSSYPTDQPTINPVISHSVATVDAWTSFTEVATKNGGEIYYQLSDDDGANWQYWNGSNWVLAGVGNYNIASGINANISSFSVTSGKIMFRAFLVSDGSQLVQLDEVRISCAQYYDWPFSTAGNYTYNASEIEVIGGVAQLLGGAGSCSGTPTACNTYGDQTVCEGQSGCSWSGGTPSCQNAGSCSAEPRQSCNSCDVAGCSRSGPNCLGTLNCTNYTSQISCESCGQCVWSGGGGSCSGTPNACNIFADQTSCQGQAGCSWSGGSYSTNSAIQPVSPYNTPDVQEYTLFTEVANKNGGEIYYKLYDGNSWYWYNGGWVTTSENTNGEWNIATNINANISSFSTSTSQIMFKAFLTGNGTQQVQLDNVKIGWGQSGGGSGYATAGWLLSSAFDTATTSAFSIIEWAQVIPSCSPSCEVKLQVRTASDAGGSPGVWTNWYGSGGSDTYFTQANGMLIPTDLNFNQWLQYRVELIGDGNDTPILEEVKINYLP